MVLTLSDLLTSSVEKSLEDHVAIAFSGGLDSTAIAAIAKRCCNAELYTAGTEGSPDLEYARKAAELIGLPLNNIILNEESIMQAYAKCYDSLHLDLLKLGILVPVYTIAEEASKKGQRVLVFGSGAEELFVGYERYYQYLSEGKDLEKILIDEYKTIPQRDIGWIKKVCRVFGVEARFPYYNRDIANFMFSVPLEDRMEERRLKKGMLREAGKIIGVPELVLQRGKKAMQYGSGVHKILMKHADELNANFPVS